MKSCTDCQQANPDDANFCSRCGSQFDGEAPSEPLDEDQLWRTFIGPTKAILFSLRDGWNWDRADRYYLEQFRKFSGGSTPHFALTWHWPAFLTDPFFWFLYRKMYLYAAVYLVGPAVAFFLTGDPLVAFVWRIIAGVSANYLYYWHIREHLNRLRVQTGPHRPIPNTVLQDTGGTQPYVFVLAIVLHLFVMFTILQGPPDQAIFQQNGELPEGDPDRF